jgi:hypothetical protein
MEIETTRQDLLRKKIQENERKKDKNRKGGGKYTFKEGVNKALISHSFFIQSIGKFILVVTFAAIIFKKCIEHESSCCQIYNNDRSVVFCVLRFPPLIKLTTTI